MRFNRRWFKPSGIFPLLLPVTSLVGILGYLSFREGVENPLFFVCLSLLTIFGVCIWFNIAKLRESEGKFAKIFETIPDPAWVATLAEGRIFKINQRLSSFLDYSPEELQCKTCLELNLWHDLEDLHHFKETLRQEGSIANFEVRFRLKSGELRNVLISATVSQIDGQDCVIGVLKDITQLKQVESQLKQQEIFLRSIYEGSAIGMFVVNVTEAGEFRFVSLNPANQRLTGLSLESLINKTPKEAQITAWEAVTQHYQDCVDAGETISYEESVRLQGQDTTFYTTLTPLRNLEGRIHRLIGTTTDITSLRRLSVLSPGVIYSVVEKPGKPIRYEYLSAAFEDIYELSLNKAFQNPSITFEQIHTEDKQGYIEALNTATKKLETFKHQWRIITPSGKIKWLQGSSRPERRDNGEVVWHGVVQDISDRRQIELELQTKTTELERFFSLTLDLLCIADTDGYFHRLNPQWEITLGYPLRELQGTRFLDYVHPDDLEKTNKAIANLSRGEQITSFVNRYRCRDGSYRWLEWKSFPVGKIIYGGARDITERQELENQLTSILNSSLDGIMTFRSLRDEEGKIVDFVWLLSNPTACKVIGIKQKDLIGKGLLEVMPSKQENGLFSQYVEVVESGQIIQEKCYHNSDGVEGWFEYVVVKLDDGFVLTFRDISEIKESEQALQQANLELKAGIAILQQRNQEMLLLSEIGDFLQVCLSVEEACTTIVDLIKPLFPGYAGAIFVLNRTTEQLEQVSSWGETSYSKSYFAVDECWGLRRGHLHQVDSLQRGLCCPHLTPGAASLCIPLIAVGKTLGLFYLSTETNQAVAENQQHLARMVGEQIASAIANLQLRATLREQSFCDPLTGLFNRRYLDESLNQAITVAEQKAESLGIIMLDIDHFKLFNDNYGHDLGDVVLQSLAKLLLEQAPPPNIVCRYGGEEIILILPSFTLVETTAKAETIRQAIASLRIEHQIHVIDSITASFGVACFPQHGTSVTFLLRAADQALLRAKENGRNQVMISSSCK